MPDEFQVSYVSLFHADNKGSFLSPRDEKYNVKSRVRYSFHSCIKKKDIKILLSNSYVFVDRTKSRSLSPVQFIFYFILFIYFPYFFKLKYPTLFY